MVAKILASMVTTVPSIVIVFLLGRFYGDVQMPIWKWIVCALAIWIGTLIFAALAVALGYKLDPDSVQPVTIVVFFAFSIFGGLWFPLSGALQKFGEFTPTYQVVKLSTDVIGQGTVALVNVIGIVIWFAIFVALATWAVRARRRPSERPMTRQSPASATGAWPGHGGTTGRTGSGTPRWRGSARPAKRGSMDVR